MQKIVQESARKDSLIAVSCGLFNYGLCSHGLYGHGLYGYGLYKYGLQSCGLDLYGLYIYGLCSYGLEHEMQRSVHKSVQKDSLIAVVTTKKRAMIICIVQ